MSQQTAFDFKAMSDNLQDKLKNNNKNFIAEYKKNNEKLKTRNAELNVMLGEINEKITPKLNETNKVESLDVTVQYYLNKQAVKIKII